MLLALKILHLIILKYAISNAFFILKYRNTENVIMSYETFLYLILFGAISNEEKILVK